MNSQALKTVGLTLFALIAPFVSSQDRIGDFSLLDQLGYFHQMSWYDDNSAIAFLFRPTGTNQSRRLFQNFPDWQRRFQTKEINFL